MSESNSVGTPQSPPLIEPCSHCRAGLDVTDAEPLAEVVCPQCGGLTQVRLLLKNYRIESVLGSGGMGSVYKALDLNLNREVAIKVINREFSRDPEHLKKFEDEARITALVNHPNVVKIFSFGSDHGVLFIAMELADKGNLDDLMNLQGRIAEAQVLEVGIQIAEGLWAAHKCGLIHRDVKPANILFADAHTAKIVDFGLACLVNEAVVPSGEIWGTPYYLAPEKLNLEPEDFRSDIYSLGATLFHAIAGRPPHEAETASMVALKHIKSKAVSLQAFAPDVSSATSYVINQMLQQDPADRYQSYAELVEHLTYARTKLLEEVPGSVKPPEQGAMEPEKQQSIVAWIVPAVLLLLLLAGTAFIFYGDEIFKKDSGSAVKPGAETQTAEVRESAADQYLRARKMLGDGDYDGGGGILSGLADTPNLPQPLGRWIRLHHGMAALLAGNSAEAKRVFTQLNQDGTPPPADKALANFFAGAGRLLAEETPVPPEVAGNYNPANHEALGLFLFALHNWQGAQFDDAEAMFQAFLKAEPGGGDEWVSEFKPIARKYLLELDAYRKIKARIAAAESLQARRGILEELQGMKSPPLQPGKLPGILLELQAGLEQSIARDASAEEQKRTEEAQKQLAEAQKREAEQAAKQAAEHARQSRALSDAKTKINKLLNGMQYDEAVAVAQGVRVTSRDLEDEKAPYLKMALWLQAFKATLSSDLTTTGYPMPVVKRVGDPVSGVTHKATKSQIQIQTPYGSVEVPWMEVAPSGLLAMAKYFTLKNKQPEVLADRLWVAGVFAYQNGLQKEGADLLKRAADMKAEYKDSLPMFGETSPP